SAFGGNINLIGIGSVHQGDIPFDMSVPLSELTDISEDLGTIELSNSTQLITDGNGGGQIVIRGGQLTVDRSLISSLNTGAINSLGISINIDVTGTVQLINRSEVVSGVAGLGRGSGGDIQVKANDIFIADGATITTLGAGLGPAGDVLIQAETSVTIQHHEDGGPVAGIFSFAGSDSAAGVITVRAGSLVMDGGAMGTSEEIRGTLPRSGSVTVEVDRLILSGGAQIDSSTGGDFPGGTVMITATEIASLAEGSVITVGTGGEADAGDIHIRVGRLILHGESRIASESSGSGAPDTITVTANEIVMSARSTVTTNAEQVNGGNIEIKAERLRLNNSSITATVNAEQGMGGNITIDSELVLLLEGSEIIARAAEGRGGNINIMAKGLVVDETSVVDASSDRGINGTVNIESVIDLSANVARLPQSFAESINLFEEPCAERLHGGRASSFVVSGRDGIPAEPSGGLPSPLVDIPSTSRDAAGYAHATRHRKAQPAKLWRQASLAHDCQTGRWRTSVSQRTP
ncbi:MAG: hypothetical protein ETSY2_49580, partial [Candidatus Entotheonella gemina]